MENIMSIITLEIQDRINLYNNEKSKIEELLKNWKEDYKETIVTYCMSQTMTINPKIKKNPKKKKESDFYKNCLFDINQKFKTEKDFFDIKVNGIVKDCESCFETCNFIEYETKQNSKFCLKSCLIDYYDKESKIYSNYSTKLENFNEYKNKLI